jgi:hypothetical protein
VSYNCIEKKNITDNDLKRKADDEKI